MQRFSLSNAARTVQGLVRKPEIFIPDAGRDVFLVTYPRSGTTWVSCIAASLMFGVSPRSLTEIDSLIPDIHALPKKSLVPNSNRYLVKSHLPLTGAPPFGEYRRVVYLIRDPRDVLFSYYRFALSQYDYTGDVSAFAGDWVCGRIWPGSWQEHVASWLGPRTGGAPFELTLLRYEDFVAEPMQSSIKLAQALELDVSKDRLGRAIADSSPEMMRKREANGASGARPGLKFIGSATAGAWKEKLAGADMDAISRG